MDIKMENRMIANHLNSVIGGIPRFSRYNDNKDSSFVHIMTINDVPEDGVSVYSTIGISGVDIGLEVGNKPLRVELMFVIDKKQEKISNILATCAFCIINSHYRCMPGAIFNDVISCYVTETDMKHVMFVQPFLWEDNYNELVLDNKIIEWLLAIPISDNECRYAEQYGSEALEELFEIHDIDIFNIYRKSVL